MAAAAVEPQPYPKFNKTMNAIEMCGMVAKQKLLLDYDQSHFAPKMTIRVEGLWVPVIPVEQKKPKKKSSRKRNKGQERTNHHVVPKGKGDKATPAGQNTQQEGIRIPLPPPPSEYIINAWLMYFRKLDHKVRGAMDPAILYYIKSKLELPQVKQCLKFRKLSATDIPPLQWLCTSVVEGLLMLDDIRHNLTSLLGAMEKFYYELDILDRPIEENPLLQEILECATKLQALLEKVDDSKLQEILKGTVKPSRNHYLASVLGLDERLLEYLETCDGHLTSEQWIVRFIESKYYLQHECLETDPSSWEDQFQSLGFTPFKAAALSDLVQNNPTFAHLSSEQWATRYIELQFKYNILLAGSRRFPHLEVDVDVDYEMKTDVDDDEEPVYIQAITKFILDKEELTQDPYFSDYLDQPRHPIESVKYWFHGTDSDAAMNICTQGISVDKGKKKLDFSDGAGFYLTRSVFK